MTGFWRTWMTAWCWVVAAFGLVFAAAAFEATSGPARLFYDIVGGSAPPLEIDAHMRITLAVLGAVMVGWGLTLLAAVHAANLLGERGRPVWSMITAAVVVWYVIDSALSVVAGFPLNAVSNTGFTLGFLIPLLGSGVLRGRMDARPA